MSDIIDYKAIKIEMTDDSPKVILDEGGSIFKIEGSSYPEDAFEFYKQVINWVSKIKINKKTILNCDFNFNILSSASHKMIYAILLELENLNKKSKNVIINWYYLNFDEDMYEVGEGFSDNINIPFKFFPIQTS